MAAEKVAREITGAAHGGGRACELYCPPPEPYTYLKFMPKVTLLPGGQSAEVPANTLLLDAGEAAGVEMEAGCFNCSCGTCVVAIASGMENLDPPTDEELNVLDQWNKDPEKYRLTCCVKIQKGEVIISLEH